MERRDVIRYIVKEAAFRALLALENADAIDLDKMRNSYGRKSQKYIECVEDALDLTVKYPPEDLVEIDEVIVGVIADGCNRVVNALEQAKAISREKLRYLPGSDHYELVTNVLVLCNGMWKKYRQNENSFEIVENTKI